MASSRSRVVLAHSIREPRLRGGYAAFGFKGKREVALGPQPVFQVQPDMARRPLAPTCIGFSYVFGGFSRAVRR